ncbi:hypothetical protein NVP1063O_202 [Vibrio phage 1.063.O._10N.261.45.C7]|nr:hypothetical protein NVP1063O_202 [Vibrio phage 1.063.O._10N.261.45.C7]
MSLIKVDVRMQLVDCCGTVLGTLFKDMDERITWRKNPLVERDLTRGEQLQVAKILGEWNNEH